MKTPKFPVTVQVRLTDALVDEIDDWRREARDLPTRSEAIRRIIRNGLKERPPARRG